jgi:hypothetical protein
MALKTGLEILVCNGLECVGFKGELVGGMFLFSIPKLKNVYVLSIGGFIYQNM